MRRRVNVGEDFEAQIHVEYEPAREAKTKREATRSWIALTFIVLATLMLLGAAAVGVPDGSYGALQAVWNASGAPLGAIITYYFGKHDD